jgi:hypothetical protein
MGLASPPTADPVDEDKLEILVTMTERGIIEGNAHESISLGVAESICGLRVENCGNEGARLRGEKSPGGRMGQKGRTQGAPIQ